MLRALTVAVTFALLAPLATSAQASPRDTAQGMSNSTVKDSAEQLPESYLRRSKIKGGGRFLPAKEVAAFKAANTAQLLARVSGGNIRDIGGGQTAIVGSRGSRSNPMASVENELCLVGLAVNDVRVPPGFDMASVHPTDIIALEFYRGPATIPPEFGGTSAADAGCGLIVLWVNEGKRSPLRNTTGGAQ